MVFVVLLVVLPWNGACCAAVECGVGAAVLLQK